MLLLTVAIVVLNIGLGFAIAMYLGYGPPTLLDAWHTVGELGVPLGVNVGMTHDSSGLLGTATAFAPDEPVAAPETPRPASTEPAGTETPASASETALDLDERLVETSVLKLNLAMLRSDAKVTDLDTRLHACQGQFQADVVASCLEEFKEDCQTYLAEQRQAAEQFRQSLGQWGDLAGLGEQIEMTNLEQAAQIETTLSNLEGLDVSAGLPAAGERLLSEIDKLRGARHKLRDAHEQAFAAVARQEGRLGSIDEQFKQDRLTPLPTRVGLEATLHQWHEEKRFEQGELCAALLDLDQFQPVNQRHGSLAGDRVLYHVAQYLLGAAGEGSLVGRFAGQQFLIVTVNQGPRTVSKTIEMIRQSIERMTFARGDQSLSLTATAALTPVNPDDTPETIFERLGTTLATAKRSGPNRTFLCDGAEPQLVQSPNLGAEYRDILI